MSAAVRFLLNDQPVTVEGLHPTTTLLDYLRYHRGLTGTKEGCAEGDCGACTLVLGELAGPGGSRLRTRAVNACIQFVPTLDGKAVYTVEYLKQQADGDLHPVQQALVDCHGSQCGFCTPGFAMSLWGHYIDHQTNGPSEQGPASERSGPARADLARALSGNLCRCTGYKPILAAGERMYELPPIGFDRAAVVERLRPLQRTEPLRYQAQGETFHAPRSLDELTRLRAEHPGATVLAGCTDVGLWVNKQFRELGDILYLGEVAELKQVRHDDTHLRIGAGVNLTDAYRAMAEPYPEIRELWERFASLPIRNAGTLGGNIANGSPIGDSMPWLIAVGAGVVLCNAAGSRRLPLEDLYTDYMKQSRLPDELVAAIEVPLPSPQQRLRTYKVCKRYDSDISAVCAAFAIELDGDLIRGARVAFGGMAATPKRAAGCEAALTGQPWTEATANAAMAALDQDYSPLSDMRASAEYRSLTARNLLYRFFLETRPDAALADDQLSVFAGLRAIGARP